MFSSTTTAIEPDRVLQYTILRDHVALTYADVLDLWQQDVGFRSYYARLLADAPFSAYRWETPALTKSNAGRSFQFVLLNCPSFCYRSTDRSAYSKYFTDDDTDQGIVSFANLSGDATLVVPSPRTAVSAYGHLAAFLRQGPESQIDALWRVVGKCLKSRISEKPLWLSTAGGGVAWLHVRVDSYPKYYGYSPYKSVWPMSAPR